MNIRSITGFLDPGWPLDPHRLADMADTLQALRRALEQAGYTVQTLRVATPPPAEMDRPVPPGDRPELARLLEAQCFVHGIDYGAIGPALHTEPAGYDAIPEILAATENVFSSAVFADLETGLSLPAARACAQVIFRAGTISPDGFANLRFAALANVPPGTPFFPAAYHDRGTPAVAIATEAAELAVDSLRDVTAPAVARRRLVGMIEAHAQALTRLAQPVAAEREVRYLGLDFTLAPFPEVHRSLGAALEACGVAAAGQAGTIAAAAFLADSIDRAQFKRTGFCGLFFPVLEDATLAARAAQGSLTVTDLLLCATVCGAGLDTLPLPGDTPLDSLMAILLDVGALALRHNKPLTARLMPLPGKHAGDPAEFDFAYFAGSRVLALRAEPLRGLLSGTGTLELGPHH